MSIEATPVEQTQLTSRPPDRPEEIRLPGPPPTLHGDETPRDNSRLTALDMFRPTEHTPPHLSRAVRELLGRHSLAADTRLPSRIAVVSALSGEGVTTISRALSEILTIDNDARVCHVDVSWESSQPHRIPPNPTELGLVDVARGEIALAAAILISESNPRLARVPLGRLSSATREGWSRGAALDRILGQLDHEFDHVVLDCPPLLTEVEALDLVRRADGYVLVARYGATTASQVRDVVGTLDNLSPVGAVLNGYRSTTPRWFRRLLGE